MGWLEDVLANLQTGGAPPAFAPAASPFPPVGAPPDEAALAAAAREAAGQRMVRANQRRFDPFGLVNAEGPAIQLALDQAPAGTGVPFATPQGAPDGTPFGMVPPSLAAAKAMTAPPPPAPQPEPAPGAMTGPVPMPRPRPTMDEAADATDLSSRNRPAVAAPPVAPPAPVPAVAPAAEPGIMDRLKGWAPALLGAGAALQGDGGALTAQLLKRQEDQALLAQTQNLTAQALLARGASAPEVAAAVRNPVIMKELVDKYLGARKPISVGGRLVDIGPDGKPTVIGDYSDDKAPKQRELKLPDGSVQQQEWVDGAWKDVGKPAPGERDRRMSVADITKLSEEGAKAEQVRGFATTFQPGYAGWKVNAAGEFANTLSRNLPESVVGTERANAAAWWQDYDRYKNQVRHGLYGASLTKNEQAAFLKADIHPGMDPAQIQRNLETQQRLVDNSIRRKGRALVGSTYDKGAIAKAYGVEPSFFDEEDSPAPVSRTAPRRSGTIDVGGKKIGWSVN
jgi:hypothetical protein